MKVLLLTNMYPGNNNSSHFGIFVKRQAESLEREGIEMVVVGRSRESVLAYISFIIRSFYNVLFARYDLVHAHYGFHSALIPSIVRKKKLIITFHGSDALVEPFRNKIYLWIQRFVIKRADHVLAVSNDVKETLINRLGAKAMNTSVISCGVNTLQFSPKDKKVIRRELGIPEDSRVVLFAGKLDYMKGMDVLYETARLMSDILFVLVGDGKFRADLTNCRYIGPRPNEEMPKWMNAADVFVLPSRAEGTPVVLLEAMSCGIPVIATAVGGCPDLIKEGKTGYLIPAGNSEKLREKILYIIHCQPNRTAMGVEGRKKMVNNYDSTIIAKKIHDIYVKYS